MKNPNDELPADWWILMQSLYRIVYEPYFQIYGELFIDDFSNDETTVIRSLAHYKKVNASAKGLLCGEESECCFRGNSYDQSKLERATGLSLDDCYYEPKLSVLATGLYMIIANVIMLNLLIAIFSHRYQTVQLGFNSFCWLIVSTILS